MPSPPSERVLDADALAQKPCAVTPFCEQQSPVLPPEGATPSGVQHTGCPDESAAHTVVDSQHGSVCVAQDWPVAKQAAGPESVGPLLLPGHPVVKRMASKTSRRIRPAFSLDSLPSSKVDPACARCNTTLGRAGSEGKEASARSAIRRLATVAALA